MQNGTVKWFNTRKGYGFITPDGSSENGKDIFVHYSNIVADEGEFRTLNEKDEVKFEIAETDRGLEARNVVITKEAPFVIKRWDTFY
ncbi:MAG: cold shock domain-containing protein [Candidatus Lokiarchaeota archaeon]|nr:cold shock domain-containing protein [Candidatus Lokiarchaeota archaeon]